MRGFLCANESAFTHSSKRDIVVVADRHGLQLLSAVVQPGKSTSPCEVSGSLALLGRGFANIGWLYSIFVDPSSS